MNWYSNACVPIWLSCSVSKPSFPHLLQETHTLPKSSRTNWKGTCSNKVHSNFSPTSHKSKQKSSQDPVFPFALGKSRACWHHPPIHTHTNEELLRHSDSEKRVVNKNSPRRPQDAPGLEGFPVDCPGTVFFIFFLGNPHFLKGVQRGQDGATEERPRKQVRWTVCGGPGFFSLPPTATVLEQCF